MFAANTISRRYLVGPNRWTDTGGRWNLLDGDPAATAGDAIWVSLDLNAAIEVEMGEQFHAELTEEKTGLWTRHLSACVALLIVHKTDDRFRISFTHMTGGIADTKVDWSAIGEDFPASPDGSFHCVLVLADHTTSVEPFLERLKHELPHVPLQNTWVYQQQSGSVNFGIDWRGNIGEVTQDAVGSVPYRAPRTPAAGLTFTLDILPSDWIVSDSENDDDDADDDNASSSGPDEVADESA
ncbi:hypothetical protein F183_A43860 [Bryobacterales bacterium F-183]|nr:hypothetical protein F183_A43860 [Bryobacterales bacterium F-183]